MPARQPIARRRRASTPRARPGCRRWRCWARRAPRATPAPARPTRPSSRQGTARVAERTSSRGPRAGRGGWRSSSSLSGRGIHQDGSRAGRVRRGVGFISGRAAPSAAVRDAESLHGRVPLSPAARGKGENSSNLPAARPAGERLSRTSRTTPAPARAGPVGEGRHHGSIAATSSRPAGSRLQSSPDGRPAGLRLPGSNPDRNARAHRHVTAGDCARLAQGRGRS